LFYQFVGIRAKGAGRRDGPLIASAIRRRGTNSMTPDHARRLVGVDVGGTFTDVMAIDGGRVIAAKIPTDVHHSETSVLAGAAEVGVELAGVFNLASTAGLNAIITRRIPKVAFLVTKGHRDILDRGRL
jgi:N-methylhydantoinase A/oxoprolinase/acetone carboxylase beta subunit